MMTSSFFDIFTEVSTDGGMPLPIAGTPTVVWHTDSFFDVFWEADVPGQERQFVQMSFRVPEGQSVKFVNPTVGPMVQSFFDVFLEVVNTGGGQINPTLPLFRVVMNANFGWRQPWPVPGNVVKFRQNPDTIRGMDVLDSWLTNNGPATLLADDFICTRTGPVTDIHLWGSWLNNLVDYWPTFWVGIWSDVPRSNNIPSHPGQLLWWQQFSPGQYRASLHQKGPVEQFLDPNAPPIILGVDNQIWKYDFFPQKPFRQLGSPQLPRVYWLSVVTKTAPGRVFGWKTTPDHYNDFAVYARTPLTFSGELSDAHKFLAGHHGYSGPQARTVLHADHLTELGMQQGLLESLALPLQQRAGDSPQALGHQRQLQRLRRHLSAIQQVRLGLECHRQHGDGLVRRRRCARASGSILASRDRVPSRRS